MIYQQRNDILDATELSDIIAAMREDCMTDLVRQYVPVESVEEQWDLATLERVLADDWQVSIALQQEVQGASAITDDEILEKVLQAAHASFDAKVDQVGRENFTQFERMVVAQVLTPTGAITELAGLSAPRHSPAWLCPEAAQARGQARSLRAVPPA